MKKVYLAILGTVLISAASYAQKGNNAIGVAVDAAVPVGSLSDATSFGIGSTAKGLYGIGTAGQLTLTVGYTSFSAKKEIKEALGASKFTQGVIPILAGYRHNFNGFFAEPQIGYGIYTTKIKGGLFESDGNEGALTWAIGGGYVFNKKIEAGVRYQSGTKDGESSGFIGVRVGYNFSL